MTGAQVLSSLRARGARLSAVEDRIEIEAPRGLITPGDRATLVARKPEILALLRSEDQHAEAPPGLVTLTPAWRERIARLDHASWVRWRHRSGEIQGALGRHPTVAEILAADRQAASEILEEIDATGAPSCRARLDAERLETEGEPSSSADSDAAIVVTDAPVRWQCVNPFCLHKTGWWRSVYGVINCSNCRPPSFPSLVVSQGTVADAPLIESDQPHNVVESPAAEGPHLAGSP